MEGVRGNLIVREKKTETAEMEAKVDKQDVEEESEEQTVARGGRAVRQPTSTSARKELL